MTKHETTSNKSLLLNMRIGEGNVNRVALAQCHGSLCIVFCGSPQPLINSRVPRSR